MKFSKLTAGIFLAIGIAGIIVCYFIFHLNRYAFYVTIAVFFIPAIMGLLKMLRYRKQLAGFRKPQSFDYNIAVIGAGAAGLVAAYIGSALKARIALIEENKMGGDCLNTGCVPSKSLLASARLMAEVNRAREYGFKSGQLEFDFADIMERVQAIIKKIEPHDSIERYTQLGVECIQGRATLLSPFEIKVNGQVVTAQNIILATGARPMIPDLPGLDRVSYHTSDSIWNIRKLPGRLLVLGAGPIGCELSQAFSRLGAKVSLVQRGGRILKKEDPDVAQVVSSHLEKDGIQILLNHEAREVLVEKGQKVLVCECGGKTVKVPFDMILIALGRVPRLDGFGLENLGIRRPGDNGLEVNAFLQTRFPNIFCCGDAHGRYQFTHTASHESWYAAVNALFGNIKKFRVDYRVIPWATYTHPEVARVGLSEIEAQQQGIEYEMVKYSLDDLDRAIADSQEYGFVKVLTVPGKDRILGAAVVGNHAAEVIAEFVLAMKHGIGLNKILGTIHIYPTMSEANKYAAGVWKRSHAPRRVLAWLEKYHAWRRR